MTEYVNSLMETIGENHNRITLLLRLKSRRFNEVSTRMDLKARNKTPLNERQQAHFHEFTGIYAREGGNLKESLMSIENTIQDHINLHNENTEALLQSLNALHGHQKSAIYSLRRLIASSETTLSAL